MIKGIPKLKGDSAMDEVNNTITNLGSFAEIVHILYRAAMDAGADRQEAAAIVSAYTSAFWHEVYENERRKRNET